MKKIICLLLALLFSSGCMKIIENGTGLELTKNINPVMEIEMDMVFLDELAAITKLNQIILDRMPISLEDPWPVLLNDYLKTSSARETAARKAYDDCLTKSLGDDFSFYQTYKVGLYLNLLTSGRGGLEGLLAGALIVARDTLMLEGAKEMGRRYEHAKWAISHYPLGCKCPFYSQRFENLSFDCRTCREIRGQTDCDFFTVSTEEMLYQYLFAEGGLKTWEELQISPDCLRPVEGRALGRRGVDENSFMNVFYMLFPDHIRDEAEKVDVDLSDAQGRQKAIEEKLKEKNLPGDERAALEKEQQQVEEEVSNLITAQNKLYDEALATVEVTPEKIKIAKRLLQISQFINDGFNQIAAATVALTVKMVDDATTINFSRTQLENSIAYLVTQGIISNPNAKKRVILLGKRLLTLPVNYIAIIGYATAQKFRVSKYSDYLEAFAEMEKKV